ncbi:MAG: DMT family transporter [Algicola sp.]|nr:DMT family transporter [Algicola sp.]
MLVNLIWGVGFLVVDAAINVMPVHTFNAFRFAAATIALIPLMLISRKNNKPEQRQYSEIEMIKVGFGLGFLLFLGFSLQAQALLYTTVSNTGFITGLCVPLVPIIGFLLYKTRVGHEVWIGVIAATAGLYFLTIGDKMVFNTGDLLAAISAVCYAAHIALIAKYGAKYCVVELSVIQLASTALYCMLATTAESILGNNAGYPPLYDQLSNPGVIAAIAYSGILASAFAYWVQTASQRLIPPHQIALIFATEPVFAHIAAYFILAEKLGPQGWLGAALIVAGMLYVELGGRQKVVLQPLDQVAATIDFDSDDDPPQK